MAKEKTPLTVRVDPALLRRVKIKVASMGVRLQEFVESALVAALNAK